MDNKKDMFGWNSNSFGYIEACKEAINDDDFFHRFKDDPRYRVVLEHLSPQQASYYLRALATKNPKLALELTKFTINDTVGRPRDVIPIDFQDNRTPVLITPSTLRYVKVLCDLLKEFGSLNEMNIVEVGGGYGGQCLVISQESTFKSYSLIDLEQPVQLAHKYLNHFGLENIHPHTPDDLPNSSFDLFVSNYAFSEIAKSTQDVYIDKVLSRCTRGYITWNNESPNSDFEEHPYDYEPLVKRLSEFHTLREDKEDAPGSSHPIIIWG